MKRLIQIASIFCFCVPSLAGNHPAPEGRASYEISFSEGVVALNDGDYEKALRAFREALAAKPGDNSARYHEAVCYQRMGKDGKAIEVLKGIIGDDPDYAPARIRLGIVFLEAGKGREAAEVFSDLAERQPDSATARLYLGRALAASGEKEKALENFVTAREMDPAYTALSYYEEARVNLALGEREGAGAALEKVVQLEPQGSELSRLAVQDLEWLKSGGKPKRLRVRASTRYEYDDNVTLTPDDRSVVVVTDEKDWRFATYVQIEYLPVLTEKFELATTYNFYQSVHNHIGDFNLQAHSLDNVASLNLGRFQPYCGYIYRYYFLDDNKQSFIRDHEIVAGINIAEGSHSLTNLDYSYLAEKYFLEYYDPDDNRTARNNSFGFNQYLFFLGGGRYLRFGMHYDRNDARGCNYTYNGYRFNWELYLPVRWGWTINSGIEYYIKDFPHNVDDRRDHQQGYAVRLARRLNEYIEVGFEYYRANNNSRVALFKYGRDIYSLVAGFKF